jgi:hypothetical protein
LNAVAAQTINRTKTFGRYALPSLDFINKSFECLELIGWQHAPDLLPSVVGQMVAARGADESTEWRQPVDLVALCRNASADLS